MTAKSHENIEVFALIRGCTIDEIAKAYPKVVEDLRNLDPIRTAAMFAGLLAIPGLQANCFRIEVLIHLAMAYCEGDGTPTDEMVVREFERLGGGYCGRMEDPAEDAFVTLVDSPEGNFRIFEGLVEGAAFHLQRVVGIVGSMPNGEPFGRIRDVVGCMLHISDVVAERAGLRENLLGQELPAETLSTDVIKGLATASNFMRFEEAELTELGIAKEQLTDFVFNLDSGPRLRGQRMGHTDLERRPLVYRDGCFYLLLPTALSSAITRLVIESVIAMDKARAFEHALANEYSELFCGGPFLGKRLGSAIEFQRLKSGRIAAMMTEVDSGRFLHLIFFVDGVNGFLRDGFNGQNADPDELSAVIDEHIKRASTEARQTPQFRNGISLIVSCGFGRVFGIELANRPLDEWRTISVSAYDLMTLNFVDGFSVLSLWSLLDAERVLGEHGVSLLNVNGLLNLVAWTRQLHGHLVPHSQLPDGFGEAGSKNLLMVPQNAIRELRHKVIEKWDPRRVLDSECRWVKVRKLDRSKFEEDNVVSLYGSEEDARQGSVRGVYLAQKRPWWIGIKAPENAPAESVYEYWVMLCRWLRRAAPVLDDAYDGLPPAPIAIEVTFAEIVGTTSGFVKTKSAEELRSLFQISSEVGSCHIGIGVARGFADGVFNVENLAERALVEAMVEGAAIVGNEQSDKDKRTRLVVEICPNSQARSMHRFEARSFRDFVGPSMPPDPVVVDLIDDAASRIGLGWKVRARESGSEISGVGECTLLLNGVVKIVLDELCSSLRSLDRHSFLTVALANHEATARDRDIWKRTAQANIAMHDDQQAALRTIAEHQGRLNASFLATRILLEAGVCECPLDGGGPTGHLDLARAMSRVLQAHHYGGWSDAIHWGAMEPRVRITALGDVHVNHDFMERIYEPFGREVGEADVRRAISSYEKLYKPIETVPSVASVLDDRFLHAWVAEFGVSLDAVRSFVDKLEDMGREPPRAVFRVLRSVLVKMLASAAGISTESASETLSLLTLSPRANWRVVSGDFSDKDWFPWRFRRRLSALRRPLIQVDGGQNPTYIIAPGLVRDALFAMSHSFHSGEVPSSQARSSEMRKWIGHANNVQRSEFNSVVARRMRDLGWQVDQEVKLTKIVGHSLNRDYGDVDVLAWRSDSGRVLAMECKDVQYNKTLGQVAEQLADFRGEMRSDGKPDNLKKHLDRLEVLNTHKSEVARTLKLGTAAEIEGHLVFRNHVPMRFAWERMASRVKLALFEELDHI